MSASEIGLTLALQQLVAALLSGAAASLADGWESKFPNQGRAQVVAAGVGIGTACFLLHGAVASFAGPIAHAALQALYAAAGCLVWPVLDGMTIQYLRGREEEYGRERLFGAVSWAVTNLAMSFALDKLGFGIMYPLTLLSATGVLASLWVYVKSQVRPELELRPKLEPLPLSECAGGDLPVDGPGEPGSSAPAHRAPRIFHDSDALGDENSSPSLHGNPKDQDGESLPVHDHYPDVGVWHMLRRMTRSGLTLAFAICVLCLAIGQVLVDSLVFLLFEYLGSSYTVMGWTVVLTVLFEIPIFSLAPALLERIGSPALLMVAGGCYVVRSVAYSLVPRGHVLYVLLVEPLHGVTYACAQSASVDFVARGHPLLLAPPGREASSQGVLQAIKAAGSVAGLAAGGVAEGTVGPRVMYRASAGAVAAGCAVFAAAWHRDRRRRGRGGAGPGSAAAAAAAANRPHRHERVPTSCGDDDVELAGMEEDE
jgi:hypothetical protein